MKVTQLWVYPIKGLRGIRLDEADLTPQGIRYDRHFMLCKVTASGDLQKMQLSKHPQCALFAQEFVGPDVHVRYLAPKDDPPVPAHPLQKTVLDVPLEPDVSDLEMVDVNLHQSMVSAYRMGTRYDAWFSACFGFDTIVVYIGDQRRPILGTFAPGSQPAVQKGWLSAMSSYDTGRPAVGEYGAVLKKLMSDRRIDAGNKYSPVFGRYAFLAPGREGSAIALHDDMAVTSKTAERPVWDWPLNDPKAARFYSSH